MSAVTVKMVELIRLFIYTKQGGSVVMHRTHIREVPGSIPVTNQSDCCFRVLNNHQGKCWLEFHFHLS